MRTVSVSSFHASVYSINSICTQMYMTGLESGSCLYKKSRWILIIFSGQNLNFTFFLHLLHNAVGKVTAVRGMVSSAVITQSDLSPSHSDMCRPNGPAVRSLSRVQGGYQ